jgi:hypothetical protein
MKWMVLLLAAGCGGGSTSPVAVTFKNSTASPSIGTGLSGPIGQSVEGSGTLMLSAQASKGAPMLLIQLDDPGLMANTPVNVGDRHLDVEYDAYNLDPNAPPGWASISGSITFTSLSPHVISFNDVAMQHATPNAMGTFILSGVAEFNP